MPVCSRWRAYAAPIIAEVLEDHRESDEATLRAALRDAYPFGERRRWPYKVWLSEIRRQLSGDKHRCRRRPHRDHENQTTFAE